MKNLTTVCFLVAALLAQPATAAPPVFNGNLSGAGRPWYDVSFYGAVANGSTDTTSAISSAESAAHAAGGGVVYIPCAASPYEIVAGNLQLYSNVDIVGQGRNCVTLQVGAGSPAGGIVYQQSAVSNVRISGITFDCNNISGVNAIQINAPSLSNITLQDNAFKNGKTGWMVELGQVGSSSTTYSTNIAFRNNIVGPSATGTAEAVILTASENSSVQHNTFTGNTSSAGSLGVYAYNYGVAVSGNVFVGNTSDFYVQQSDFVTFSGNVHIAAQPSSGVESQVINSQDITIADTFTGNANAVAVGIYDNSGSTFDGTHTSIHQNSNRITVNSNITGAYEGLAVPYQVGSGHNTAQTNIVVSGVIAESQYAAVNIPAQNAGTGISGLTIQNLIIPSGAWGSQGAGAGAITVNGSANTTGVSILGGFIGSTTNSAYGIYLNGSGLTGVRVVGADLHNAGASGIHPYLLGGGATFGGIWASPGVNFTGASTPPTVPASGTSQTNTFPTPENVCVQGGTVSGINYGPSTNAVATSLTSGCFLLQPGWVINVSYSVAPTWTWVAQ